MIRGSTAMQVPFEFIVSEFDGEAEYQANGTGAGQTSALAGLVDIGTGDVPIPSDEFKVGILTIPVMVGGIAVIHNVDEEQVNLTACTLAGIYSGDITSWGAEEIVQDNPSLEGSDLEIKPVARSDSSGSTEVFSGYLSQACPEFWKLGAGKTVNWPDIVIAVEGTSRVVEEVNDDMGTIGYAAINQSDKEVAIEAADGNFETSSSAEFGFVGEKQLPQPDEDWGDVEFIFEDGGFPTSFVGLMYVNSDSTEETKEFINHALSDEIQNGLEDFGFKGLPENLKSVALEGLESLEAIIIRGSTAIQEPMEAIIGSWNEKVGAFKVVYQAEGTGAGQEAILAGDVDIGTGDVPIPAVLEQDNILHIPTIVGGIAVIHNVADTDDIQLTACDVANIFQGQVTSWGDVIDGIEGDIIPIGRLDSSGSTNVFTAYLEAACAEWELGSGNTVNWPDVVIGKDNTGGIIDEIARSSGSISYAAIGRWNREVAIEAADGEFDTSTSAEFGVVGDKDLPAADESWANVEFIFEEGGFPTSFVGYFYVNKETSAQAKQFIEFVLSDDGQNAIPENFRPLPDNVLAVAKAGLDLINIV